MLRNVSSKAARINISGGRRAHKLSIHRLYSSSPPLTNPLEPLVHGSNELPHPRLDYRNIADNVVYKSTNAINRKAPLPANAVQSVVRSYTESKRISTSLNAKRSERAAIGETIRNAPDPEAKQRVLETGRRLKEEIAELESQLAIIDTELLEVALAIPNDTHPSAPLGPEEAAITISTQGPDPLPPSPERDHVEICRKLGLLDLASGASVTGSSWYYLMNEAALLEIALTNYALSVAIRNGFTPVMTPDVVRSDIAKRCGFQPRDQADPPVSQMYHLESPVTGSSSSELVLSGTAEIPLAGMFANKIFPPTNLPLKVVGVGKAFRAEAGARGADTRGLYRVHQFSKVELFAVTTAEQSEEVMEDMAKLQMSILSGLGFPFRVLDMPTEELGASAYRKYDMEAWMPGRGKWGEVSSLSNCTDYQARRLLIRHSKPSGSAASTRSTTTNTFAHTLNGTAAAIPRLIIALLENGAIFDEKNELVGIRLPDALKPFWLGSTGERNLIQWE